MFVQLHGHSHYSLLEAIGKPVDVVTQAKKLNMTALGLTDYHGMYGVIDFYKSCLAQDIKPLLGVEIALVQDRNQKGPKEQTGTIILLAKNHQGYLDLLEIVSHGNLEGFHIYPRIDRSLLQEKGEHLIARMGGERSLLGQMILHHESDKKIQEMIELMQSFIGKNDFYIEVIVQDEQIYPSIQKINQANKTYAKLCGCELFCSTNYHYIHVTDKEAFEVALSIKDGKRIYDEDRRKANGDWYLMGEMEVRNTMLNNNYEKEDIERMMAMSRTIADKVQIDIPLNTILFPNYDSDPEIQKIYEQVKETLITE